MAQMTKNGDEAIASSFLRGGGEMGQRIRAFDWASTPVGPIGSWPQSLLVSVNTILNSRFPMFIWWGKDLIQFYNDAYRPSLGNDGKHPSALGQRGEECWPEIWPVINPLIRQVLDGGESTWSENQLIPIYRNGRLEDVYWTFSYSPIIDEGGEVGGVLVVCNENTDKVLNLFKLEESYKKIKESEDQLSFAIEAAELGTWDYNPLTDRFSSNSRLKSWFGFGPYDRIELSAAINAMIEKDRRRVVTAIQRALQYESGGFYDIEYTIVNGVTGQERVVRAKGRAWFNEDRVAYRFNGTLQDITEQEQTRLKIVRAEETARLAIESADLGTYEIDLLSGEILVSDRYKVVFGISEFTDKGKIEEMMHPEDRASRIRAHADAERSGNLDYETRIRWEDGSGHWVRVKGRYIYNETGKATRLIGMVQDITEQKQFSEQLKQQVAERTLELQRSNEDLLQFAHVITHDLKEPVRKVKVFSNRIKDEMKEGLSPKVNLYLDKIQNASDRMFTMIEGVLNYSSLSADDETVDFIDLNEVIRSIQGDLEIMIQQKAARIEYASLPTIQGAPILIYQLFYNLINNSLKFSRDGVDPVITISSSLVREEGRDFARVSIADNGIGFDQQYAGSIFNTFARLHSKDKFEGTGMGLALSKKIAERHGGTIAALGAVGEGATFILTLPLLYEKRSV
jgi:PAS domain S-box-containing protein